MYYNYGRNGGEFMEITGYTTEEQVRAWLPKRAETAHKGNFGRVLLLCGSVGYTGAAALAARAAARCGSGLVFIGVPQTVYSIVAAKLEEPMVFPLPDRDGMFSVDAVDGILRLAQGKDAVLFGPGCGRGDGILACAKALLENLSVPLVIDADGINVLQEHKNVLRESACPVIVTPHEGEFLRLGGNLSHGREAGAKLLAADLDCICVLKGSGTVVSDGKQVFVNSTGNPGMACGGSGDVLAGMLTSFLGQGLSPMDAARCAVWLHGRAGDLCAAEIGEYGMLPSDMIQVLPRLLP